MRKNSVMPAINSLFYRRTVTGLAVSQVAKGYSKVISDKLQRMVTIAKNKSELLIHLTVDG
jgi:hypothetical protein